MSRKRLVGAFSAIGVSICLYGLGCIGVSQTVAGSTHRPQDPTVELPEARNPTANVTIGYPSMTVSIPAQGEFYVAGQRLTREALAALIRDTFVDKPRGEQMVYVRGNVTLSFGAVREVLNVVRQAGHTDIGFIVRGIDPPRDAVLESSVFVAVGFKVDPADLITLPPPRQMSAAKGPPPPPLPRYSSERPREAPGAGLGIDALVVTTKPESSGPDQAVALNTRVMSLSKLQVLLQDLLEQRPAKHVFINPSRDSSFRDVIAAMDVMKGAGTSPIFVLIDEVAMPGEISGPTKAPPPINVPGGVPGGVPQGVPGGEPEGVLRKSGAALKQSATRRVEPVTPALAKVAKVLGVVVVEVTVDENGDVIDAHVISGHPLLKDAAVDAARGWKFTPGRLRGKPVKVIGPLALTFK